VEVLQKLNNLNLKGTPSLAFILNWLPHFSSTTKLQNTFCGKAKEQFLRHSTLWSMASIQESSTSHKDTKIKNFPWRYDCLPLAM
jgi:hypothetical protein